MITLLCAGTGTDVGKTWVGAETLRRLRAAGFTVAARKPVQSFDPLSSEPTDAEVLAKATGQRATDVCPPERNYPLAMAPPIAATLLGTEGWLLCDLAEELEVPEDLDVFWVETVGGPRSPMADDGDSADLARWVQPDAVVLVADAGLGTINAVRLSVLPFAGRTVLVVLNRFDAGDDIHRTNHLWLAGEGFDVLRGPAELADRLAASISGGHP